MARLLRTRSTVSSVSTKQENTLVWYVRTYTYVHVYERMYRPAADSRTQGYFRGPSPQHVALRGVMQALVRIQAGRDVTKCVAS